MSETKILHFCTYFDLNYLHRGLALYRSIVRHIEKPFKLWILCLDDETGEILNKLQLPNVEIILLADFQKDDKPLRQAKKNRSKVEYYWTCTPSLLLYIFKKHPEISLLAYLDSDMYFFSNPNVALEKLDTGSILILPHDYSEEYKGNARSGKYNVGVLVFRLDENSLACLKWWRNQCLNWCYAYHKNGKFGDQVYLDDWPKQFKGVVVSDCPELNAGPWNISKYPVSLGKQKIVLVNNEPLICYHFHGLYFCTHRLVFLAGWPHTLPLIPIVKEFVYTSYIREILAIEKELIEKNFPMVLPMKDIPWRYIGGRLLKLQPLHCFLWMTRDNQNRNVCYGGD